MKKKQSQKKKTPVIPELLAPAGNFEKLATAVHYGADAVYLGGREYGLRAKAGNFDENGIRRAVEYAHEHQVNVYTTVNIFAHNEDFNGLDSYLELLGAAGVDGLIAADPGIIARIKRVVPHVPIHLSTQANVTNSESANFWLSQGIERLNLARELSLQEIRQIRKAVVGDLEIFVHGALCISYSGRCLLSQYLTGRDANQGNCAHPCRYSYTLLEEKRPDQFFPVEEDRRGTYLFNSKDLCLLNRLPDLLAAGVNSLKIEGRMKSIFYVGGVVRVYRAALDYLQGLDPSAWLEPEKIRMPQHFMTEIAKTGTRDMTLNFFDERPGADEMLYGSSRFDQDYEPVAVIREVGPAPLVEVRNALEQGEEIEYMPRSVETIPGLVTAMIDEKGIPVLRANPGNRVRISFAEPSNRFEERGIFRRRKKAEP